MKTSYLAAAALLAGTVLSSTAQASDPIKINVSGTMYKLFVAADQDNASNAGNNAQNFDVIGSTEVWFLGKTKLDNGITVGVDVQLEGGDRSANDPIDESYMYISGDFGKIIIGDENGVAYKMGFSAPGVSVHGAAAYDDALDDLLLRGDVTRSYIVSWYTGDASKVSYFSPRMYGLQAGVSYTPSNDGKGSDGGYADITRKPNAFDDAWEFALNYNGKISDVGVNVGATYTWLDSNKVNTNDDDKISDVNLGLNLSYGGFTVGGAALISNADAGSSYAAYEGVVWNAGIQYKEGPYEVSFTYANSEVEGSTTDGREDKVEYYQFAANYALGPGVKLVGDISYMNAEDESGEAANGNEGAIGTAVGLSLSF